MEYASDHSADSEWEFPSSVASSDWSFVSQPLSESAPEQHDIAKISGSVWNSPSPKIYEAVGNAKEPPALRNSPDLQICVPRKCINLSTERVDDISISRDHPFEERMPHRSKGIRLGVATGASISRKDGIVTRRELGRCYVIFRTSEEPHYKVSTPLSLAKASSVLAATPHRPTIHPDVTYGSSDVQSLPSINRDLVGHIFPGAVSDDVINDCRVLNTEVTRRRVQYGGLMFGTSDDTVHKLLCPDEPKTTPEYECVPNLVMTRKGRSIECLQRERHECTIEHRDSAVARHGRSASASANHLSSSPSVSTPGPDLLFVCERYVQKKSAVTKLRSAKEGGTSYRRNAFRREIDWEVRHGEFGYDDDEDYYEDPTDEEIVAALKKKSCAPMDVDLSANKMRKLPLYGPNTINQRITQKYYDAAIFKQFPPNPTVELSLDPDRYVGPRKNIARAVPRGYALSKYEVVLRTDLAHRFEQAWAQILVDHNKNKALYNSNNSKNCYIDPVNPVVGYYGCSLEQITSIVREGFQMPSSKSANDSDKDCRDQIHQTKGIRVSPRMNGPWKGMCQDMDSKKDTPGLRVIVCAVLMGRVHHEDRNTTYPSLRPQYHSHLTHNKASYVVFSPAQILPVYVLYLRKLGDKKNPNPVPTTTTGTSPSALADRAAKLLPYGFGEGNGKMVVTGAGSISDDDDDYDEEQACEYQWSRYEETTCSRRLQTVIGRSQSPET